MKNPNKLPPMTNPPHFAGGLGAGQALRASTDDGGIIGIASKLLSACAKVEVRFEILMAEKVEAQAKASHFESLYDILEKERGEHLRLAHEYTQNREGYWTLGDDAVLAVINDAIRLRQEFCPDKCDVGKR